METMEELVLVRFDKASGKEINPLLPKKATPCEHNLKSTGWCNLVKFNIEIVKMISISIFNLFTQEKFTPILLI